MIGEENKLKPGLTKQFQITIYKYLLYVQFLVIIIIIYFQSSIP